MGHEKYQKCVCRGSATCEICDGIGFTWRTEDEEYKPIRTPREKPEKNESINSSKPSQMARKDPNSFDDIKLQLVKPIYIGPPASKIMHNLKLNLHELNAVLIEAGYDSEITINDEIPFQYVEKVLSKVLK